MDEMCRDIYMVAFSCKQNGLNKYLLLTEKNREVFEMGPARTTVLREMAERPRTFLELLNAASMSYAELSQLLEALISEGSVGKTSDGFQSLYSVRGTTSQ
jgi:DNA-binding HxlR family transcriptional regulator